MEPWLVSTRTKARESPDQAGLQYACMWVRSRGRPGWGSLQHLLAGMRVRIGCRPGWIGMQYLAVHIRVGTWAGQSELSYSIPQHELGLGAGQMEPSCSTLR